MGEIYRVGSDLRAAMSGTSDQPIEPITHRDLTNSRTSFIANSGHVAPTNDAQHVAAVVQIAGLERLEARKSELEDKIKREPVDANGYPRDYEAMRKLKLQLTNIDDTIEYQTYVANQQLQRQADEANARDQSLIKELELSQQIRDEKALADLRRRNGG